MIDHGIVPEDRLSRLTSVQYQMAVAALAPEDAFDIAQASRQIPAAIQSFMAKVKVTADEALLQDFPKLWRARVRVQSGGRWLEREVTHVPGDPGRPFDDAAIRQKFQRLVGRAIGEAPADAIIAEVRAVLDGRSPPAQLLASIERTRDCDDLLSRVVYCSPEIRPGYSEVPKLILIVFSSTAKMTAVDHPNNSAPFIAVMGPSSRQSATGVTSP